MAKGLNNSHKLMKLWLRFGAYCTVGNRVVISPRSDSSKFFFDSQHFN